MLTDPKGDHYKPNSQARKLSDQFNQTYTTLLRNLHQIFNGSPAMLQSSIDFMTGDLASQANALIATRDEVTGQNATPTFEYNPT